MHAGAAAGATDAMHAAVGDAWHRRAARADPEHARVDPRPLAGHPVAARAASAPGPGNTCRGVARRGRPASADAQHADPDAGAAGANHARVARIRRRRPALAGAAHAPRQRRRIDPADVIEHRQPCGAVRHFRETRRVRRRIPRIGVVGDLNGRPKGRGARVAAAHGPGLSGPMLVYRCNRFRDARHVATLNHRPHVPSGFPALVGVDGSNASGS